MQLTHHARSGSRRRTVRGRSSNLLAVIGLAVLIALVFALDQGTGIPHVQHLYYIPIIVAGIRFGMLGGTSAAATAVVLYHIATPQAFTWQYEESDVLQVAVFVAAGFVAARLADDARRLHRLAMTDDLTGLHNLRSFELELDALVSTAHTRARPLSLAVIDVDRLKSLNDKHGHLAGAEAVRTVGRIIAEHIPSDAVACRYGGDEFVIALPGSVVGARRVADDLRRAVGACAPELAGIQFPEATLSISIGLASRSFEDRAATSRVAAAGEGEALFRAADAALYAAKNGGRNRVRHAGGS